MLLEDVIPAKGSKLDIESRPIRNASRALGLPDEGGAVSDERQGALRPGGSSLLPAEPVMIAEEVNACALT
jgi:hypothetical protein